VSWKLAARLIIDLAMTMLILAALAYRTHFSIMTIYIFAMYYVLKLLDGVRHTVPRYIP
jgi:hypothetical protein